MRKPVLKAVLMPVIGTALFGYISLFGSIEDTTTDFAPPTTVPAISLDAEVLLRDHDCWTGASPYGDLIPGHAVFRLEGEKVQYGPSQTAFDIWLHGVPGQIYGFCR